jgi:hypothetical protein
MDAFLKATAWHFSAFAHTAAGEIWRIWFDGEPGAAPVMERLTPWQRTEYGEAIKQLDALEAKDAEIERGLTRDTLRNERDAAVEIIIKLRTALRNLAHVPAVKQVLGSHHTMNCQCPLCVARELTARDL